MDDKDQYIKDLEAANQRLQEHLEDYEDNFIRKLDSLGVGRNIDMQTFSNLIDIESFVEYLSHSPEWRRTNCIGNYSGEIEYTFEFIGDTKEKDTVFRRICFVLPKKTANAHYDIQRTFRSFKDFWDLWTRLTGGKKNIALLLDILEFKYNKERGKKHGEKGN